jgi:DNA-binding GntR family transcriptional regulator
VNYAVSWLRADLVKAIPELVALESTTSTDELLRSVSGYAPVAGADEICARGASVEVARELGISEGAPVLAGHARRVNETSAVIEYREFFVPADRRLSFAYFL